MLPPPFRGWLADPGGLTNVGNFNVLDGAEKSLPALVRTALAAA